MAWYNFKKKETVQVTHMDLTNEPEGAVVKNQAFNSPFVQIPEQKLALPYISRYSTLGISVRFGGDNLYPQMLWQLYYSSPLHAACVNFKLNAMVGGGYTWTIPAANGKDSVNLLFFEKQNKFKKLIRSITKDYIIHNRVTILIKRDDNGKFVSMKRLDPSTIRQAFDNKTFEYSEDWMHQYNRKTYNLYSPTTKDKESLFFWQEETSCPPYALPTYTSILDWLAVDGEQSYLQKQNIINSIFPSIILRTPFEFTSEDEAQSFHRSIKLKAGSKGAGSVMVLSGNGMDNVPEVVQINPNTNDELFKDTDKILSDKICQAHMINPSIMGIKVAGQLGNAQEISTSYAIWEKNVVMPGRSELEEIFDELLQITGIQNTITFNNYQLVDTTVVNAPTTEAPVTMTEEEKKKPKK